MRYTEPQEFAVLPLELDAAEFKDLVTTRTKRLDETLIKRKLSGLQSAQLMQHSALIDRMFPKSKT